LPITTPQDCIDYSYNAAGRTVAATGSDGNSYASLAAYAPQGALTSLGHAQPNPILPPNITREFAYNKRLQPSLVQARTPSTTVLSLGYDFGLNVANNGNVKQIVNNLNNNPHAELHLRRAEPNQDGADTGDHGLSVLGQTFSYDIWANLLSIGGQTG
jgi:hypothetical protein